MANLKVGVVGYANVRPEVGNRRSSNAKVTRREEAITSAWVVDIDIINVVVVMLRV